MVFKRRSRQNFWQWLGKMVYPRGGWLRAASYVMHRLRRLPDSPERIARGIAAGVAVSFTPLFGFHFLSAAAIAWSLRGNVLAAILATFFGNPITFPLIVVSAMELGGWLLGRAASASPRQAMRALGAMWNELWDNALTIFSAEPASWSNFSRFGADIFLPYLLGGAILGAIAGVISYFLCLPVIRAYHRRRLNKLRARFAAARSEQPDMPDVQSQD